MKDVLWDSLLASLQSGQCVLVLGPDIPVAAVTPGTEQQIEEASLRDVFGRYLSTQLSEDNQGIGETAMFAVAQQYADSPAFSTVSVSNIAARFFGDPHHRCGPLHAKLAKFPFSVVLTTSHDDLFVAALTDAGKKPSRYIYHFKGEPRENRELPDDSGIESPAVYYLFGAHDEPNSLVLTENDLLDFMINVISGHPELPASLYSTLRNKTFLFVGFGIKHWYIRVLLKLLIRKLQFSGGSFALESFTGIDTRERDQTVLFYKRGTRIEVVDMEVEKFLDVLWDRYDKAGRYKGGAFSGTPRHARAFISYERSDEEIANRLYQELPKDRIDPFLDREFLKGGDMWNDEIEKAIRSSDYFLILNSKNLAEKTVGYVNKEIKLAQDMQAYRLTGIRFIIPLLVDGLRIEDGREDLRAWNQLPLRSELFAADVAEIARQIFRDTQLRRR